MGTISSMSPRLAYSNGGLWVSTYDEYGRRCWVNNATGERTYGFDYGGRPVDPKLPPTPTNGGTVHYTAPNGMAYAYTLPGPVPAAYPTPNAHPVPSPSGAEVVPVPYHQMGCYQAGVPPVAPVPAGRTNSNPEHFYIRPTFERGSWMWK